VLTVNGTTVTAAVPIRNPSYTVAQLIAGTPSAIPAGQMVYCSNESGGACMAYSRGAAVGDWHRFSDNAVVS